MERIIYTGAISDFYNGCDFRYILMKKGYHFSSMRTEGLTPDCTRPVIFIHIQAKEVWVGYASSDLHEFMNDDRYFITCSSKDVEKILQEEEYR
jgi:hypothetical protein|nr:MAG TPA: hypothetical protein [Caudoviricetes sp.]